MIDLKIAKQTDSADKGAVRFEVDPGEMYPMMALHLLEVKKEQAAPQGNPALLNLYSALQNIDDRAFEVYAKFPDEIPTDEALLVQRDNLLEIMRLWFTETLHLTVGGGMTIALTPARPQYVLASASSRARRATQFFGVKENNAAA